MAFLPIITIQDQKLAKRAEKGTVNVVDDDVALLAALNDLITYEGYLCQTFSSVGDFLAVMDKPRFPGPMCLLSDMMMPGVDGLAFQTSLPENFEQPLIFMSGMSTVEDAATAFRRGAIHFLIKPVNDQVLFATIEEALEKSNDIQLANDIHAQCLTLVDRLTSREKQLAKLLPDGDSIKTLATQMDISERAVKLYKKSLMEKLEIRTIAQLVQILKQSLF